MHTATPPGIAATSPNRIRVYRHPPRRRFLHRSSIRHCGTIHNKCRKISEDPPGRLDTAAFLSAAGLEPTDSAATSTPPKCVGGKLRHGPSRHTVVFYLYRNFAGAAAES